jgi:hypothetical protein
MKLTIEQARCVWKGGRGFLTKGFEAGIHAATRAVGGSGESRVSLAEPPSIHTRFRPDGGPWRDLEGPAIREQVFD